MTKEGIYEFIARQKTSLISSVGEDGYPAMLPTALISVVAAL